MKPSGFFSCPARSESAHLAVSFGNLRTGHPNTYPLRRRGTQYAGVASLAVFSILLRSTAVQANHIANYPGNRTTIVKVCVSRPHSPSVSSASEVKKNLHTNFHRERTEHPPRRSFSSDRLSLLSSLAQQRSPCYKFNPRPRTGVPPRNHTFANATSAPPSTRPEAPIKHAHTLLRLLIKRA